MREAKFRGLGVDKKFVYGHGYYKDRNESEFIINEDILDKPFVLIRKGTAGQCIILGGKEIYEGDIVKGIRTDNIYIVKWVEEESGFRFVSKNEVSLGYITKTASKIVEKIGNIHQNPELLK